METGTPTDRTVPRSLLPIIESIHRGVADPAALREALTRLAELLGDTVCVLSRTRHSLYPEALVSHGIHTAALAEYREQDWEVDAWRDILREAATGEVLFTDELMDGASLRASAWNRKVLQPQRLTPERGFLVVLDKRPIRGQQEVASILAVMCPDRRPLLLGDRERSLLEPIIPHLQIAMRTRDRQRDAWNERELLRLALNRMAIGVMVSDASGRIVLANRSAREFIDRQPDWLLRGTQLVAPCEEAIEELRCSGATPPGEILALGPSARAEAPQILATPLSDDSEPPRIESRPLAIFIGDLEEVSASQIDVLRVLYKLTPTEARLTRLLTDGLSLEQAAERQGTKISTARSRLKHIFTKTGTNRQASLVRRILTGPAQIRSSR